MKGQSTKATVAPLCGLTHGRGYLFAPCPFLPWQEAPGAIVSRRHPER